MMTQHSMENESWFGLPTGIKTFP